MAEVVQEILVDATPETIFELLVAPEAHLRWMGSEVDLDPRPGGDYRVLVAGQFPAVGQFVEVVPNEKVVFTFGWDAPDNPVPPGSSTVQISLHPEDGKTLVRLVHRGLPEDGVLRHADGWTHYLARLAVAAPGGDPGPDTRPGGAGD